MRTILVAVVLSVASSAFAAVPVGTPRPDRIDTVNGIRDIVRCGGGRDLVVADQKDVVAGDCEVVTRRIALDRTTDPGAQHRTIVEPSAAGDGATVVTVFQSGRVVDGGAAAIGWATSTDNGATWRGGLLAGSGARVVSDPVVARDRVHGVWLAVVLAVFQGETRIIVYRSPDGLDWNTPGVVAATAAPPPREQIGLDKEWVACDRRPLSPHLGSCYLAYTNLATGLLGVRSSTDGGATWGVEVPVGPPGSGGPVGALPAVEPNGTVVVVYATADLRGVESVSSTDGGTTFGPPVRIAGVVALSTPLRAPPLPSVAETTAGVIAVWPDCSAHPGCAANDIASSASSDGTTWTAPRTIASGGDYATPTVGANGDAAAVVAYVRQNTPCCRLGVRLFRSADGGATWGSPIRLDARPTQTSWLAQSAVQQGTVGFLGDYMAVAFAGPRPVPVFAAALAPQVGLRQDLYATTRLP